MGMLSKPSLIEPAGIAPAFSAKRRVTLCPISILVGMVCSASGLRDQVLAPGREDAAPQPQANAIVFGLHDQNDRGALRPTRQEMRQRKIVRARDDLRRRLEEARQTAAVEFDQRAGQEAHQARAGRIAHRLDRGDVVGVEDRRDGDAFRVIGLQ